MKYRLTDESINWEGHTLYRIKAQRNFGDVRKGDLGGFVETNSNLGFIGQCWIYDDAKVYGNAKISDNSKAFNNAEIRDNALVSGGSIIKNNAKIIDKAIVSGNITISGNVLLSGNDFIEGTLDLANEDDVALYFVKQEELRKQEIERLRRLEEERIAAERLIKERHLKGKAMRAEKLKSINDLESDKLAKRVLHEEKLNEIYDKHKEKSKLYGLNLDLSQYSYKKISLRKVN